MDWSPGESNEQREIYYPTVEDALVLHARVLGVPDSVASNTVRDLGLLESALARAPNAVVYENASLTRQAATLLVGIIRNHPFIDGNKRTAYVLMLAFLRGNGVTEVASDDVEYEMVEGVARGQVGVDEIEIWLGQAAQPYSPER